MNLSYHEESVMQVPQARLHLLIRLFVPGNIYTNHSYMVMPIGYCLPLQGITYPGECNG